MLFAAERPSRAVWCTRSFQVGAGLGLVLAVLGQGVVAWSGQEARAAAVLVSTGVFALVGLLGAALTAPWIHLRGGRPLAAGLVTAGLTLTAAHHVMATGVRILSGALPTFSGLEMFLASPSQFFHAALVGHRTEIFSLGASALVLAALLFLLLVRPSAKQRPYPLALLAAVGLGGSAAVFVLATTPGFRSVGDACPELTLLSSLGDDSGDAGISARRDARPPPSVPPGPPLSAGEAWLASAREWKGPRPNVLLILLESVPAQHLGYAGYSRAATPNIDRLASRSLRFRHVWSTAPASAYAQMALLSSLLPRRRPWLEQYEQINYPRMLFHDVFHTLGYDTATVSSQNENWQGMRRFQNTGTPTFYRDSNDHPGPHMGEGEERKLPDHLTVDVFLEWLRKQSKAPWAAYVNFQRTHFPYALPPGFTGRHQPSEPNPGTFGFLHYPREELEVVLNRYDNALEYVDAQVGRLLSHLEASGQWEDTLIILSSDHGEHFYEGGRVTHGKSLTDIQLRVPLLIHWPRRIASRDVDVPLSQLDVLPTVLELLGLAPHPSFQGRPLTELERPGAPHPAIFFTLHGLRLGDGVVCWPWKLTLDRSSQHYELYNLQEDPGEARDLYSPEAPIPAALLQVLTAQLEAQLQYHSPQGARNERYAPRQVSCPDWSTFAPGPRLQVGASKP
ncbi:MAG TPA: sulfatase [Archangium sp.]|uniref:sulfatase family protein n=1 Tax=Archangium sp. TaxID=1872627 RepID=UPI002E341FC4|nr:sulfatase [Archangium sp.]HEX5754426.1 sulfatase [Archangium sp.]